MNTKLFFTLAVAGVIPTLAYCLGSDYPPPGSERLKTELHMKEARSQSPNGYATLVDRAGLLGGHGVNSEDVFYYSGDKLSFEKFLEDYSGVTNVVAHTVIARHGISPAGPGWDGRRFAQYDWALYCHPYGWFENQRPMPGKKYVLWVELRVGGKITQQDRYNLKIPAGVQLLYVNEDSPSSDSTKTPDINHAVEPSPSPKTK